MKFWSVWRTAALRSGLAAFVVAGTVPAAAGAQQQAGAAPLVFDGVTVVDVEQGKLIPNQRVIIAGTRIQAVGAAGAVKLPKGAQVVEARGKYLIPGLWDVHTHVYQSGGSTGREKGGVDFYLPLYIANGITGVRDAHSPVPIETQVQWGHEILAGTRVGPPRQLLTGPGLSDYGYAIYRHHRSKDTTGKAGAWMCRPACEPTDDSAVVVRKIDSLVAWKVDSLKARGTNFLKVYPYSSVVAAAARRAGLPYGGHLMGFGSFPDGWPPYERSTAIAASDNGMRIIDHGPGVNTAGDLEEHCSAPNGSVERCRVLAERLRRNATGWTPLMRWPHEEMFHRAKAFWDGDPMQGNWLREAVMPASTVENRRLSIAQDAGMPMLANTDSWFPFYLHVALAMFVLEGTTPLTALQSATLEPARMLRATDSLGTVAAGKLADLVLLDADPLADITNTTTIRAVVANGRYFDRAALDSLLVKARTMEVYTSRVDQWR